MGRHRPHHEIKAPLKDDSHEAISVELTMRSDESSEIASAMTTPTQPLRVLYMDDDEMALTMTQLQLMRAGIHMLSLIHI